MVHTCLKPYFYFASFNLLILSLLRPSVINVFLPFKTFIDKNVPSTCILYKTVSARVLLCLSSFTSKFLKLLWRAETCPHNDLMT